jgi:glycosyltransferase involved in cell wall biosynthesis
VYAGSLGQGCDIETIVKAAEILARSGTPAEIVIAGDGPKRGYLESVLSQCDCANIRYVGALSQADLHGLYRGSAIGLCSYLADSTVEMPCKFYDYVAEGLAVVSSVRGELAAVIAEARLGLQYEAQSPESLAEAIAGLVASPAMLDTFRRNAGCAAASFDRPVQYGKAVRLIDDLLRERGRPPDGSRVGTRRAGVLPPSLERKPAAVVLISPFDALPGDAFRPGRFADFSGALARRKHRVIWIGSTFNHRAKARRSAQPPDEVGVTVLLVPSLAYRFNICIRREVSHIVFAIMAAWKLLPLLWKGGVESVVCSFPPILAPVFCGILAKLFRVPFVLDVHDAWPDAFEIFLPRRLPVSLVFTAGTLLRSFAGKLSCGATLVSADYKAYFGSAMPAKTIVTPLGHPFGKFWQHYAPDWNLVPKKAGDYWVTYVGTVSQNYALDVVLAGLADLPGNVKFVVAGSGLAVQSLSDRALAIGFQNLVLTGELSHSDLANLLARSDLALVPVDVRTHIRMPKKVFDYLAAGLPILTNIRGGELEEIVLSSGIGALYDPGSIDSLRAGVRACQQLDREAVRARALRLAEDRFDTAALADEFVRWLEDNIHDTGSSDLVGSGAHEAGV